MRNAGAITEQQSEDIEAKVWRLHIDRKTNAEIGRQLNLSPKRVAAIIKSEIARQAQAVSNGVFGIWAQEINELQALREELRKAGFKTFKQFGFGENATVEEVTDQQAIKNTIAITKLIHEMLGKPTPDMMLERSVDKGKSEDNGEGSVDKWMDELIEIEATEAEDDD